MRGATLRERVWRLLEPEEDDPLLERVLNFALMGLIVVNVVAVVLESVAAVEAEYRAFFRAFEVFSVSVFSAEYLARLWACPAEPRFGGRRGRLRYALTPLAVVDLVAILPFYLHRALVMDLRFVRVLRLFRLLRLLKLARYSSALRTLGRVLARRKEELLITAAIGGVVLLAASSLMYYVENEAQPAAFSSIPAAMWWGVVTLTTVGYGDVYPITPLGRVLGALVEITGVGLVALPAGILAGGFAEELQRERREAARCPHCGRELDA